MKYISFFDDKGERLTSIVEGIHFNNFEEEIEKIKEKYKEELNYTYFLELTSEEHNNLLNNDLVYKDGELTEREAPTFNTKELMNLSDRKTDNIKNLSLENREDILKEILLRLDELEEKENSDSTEEE